MAVHTGRGSREHRRSALDRAQLIPGGALTHSKDDTHFPPNAPRFISGGRGATVWDSMGKGWLDWGMGLRSVILGHGHPEVLQAARAAMEKGSNHTRPTLLEGELAERLCDLIPCGLDGMAKFGKNGSDAVTAAVRIARAATGRVRVLACRQAFFASDDWWLTTQERSLGTWTGGLGGSTQLFDFGTSVWDDDELFAAACVVLSPMEFEYPEDGWLEQLRIECDRAGTVLIFDEVISGFRFDLRGAQHVFGVTPDLTAFGKAMANGFSVSALVGK